VFFILFYFLEAQTIDPTWQAIGSPQDNKLMVYISYVCVNHLHLHVQTFDTYIYPVTVYIYMYFYVYTRPVSIFVKYTYMALCECFGSCKCKY
jgi:hypothetical protein